jgi:hypothetical protein
MLLYPPWIDDTSVKHVAVKYIWTIRGHGYSPINLAVDVS